MILALAFNTLPAGRSRVPDNCTASILDQPGTADELNSILTKLDFISSGHNEGLNIVAFSGPI